jgi:hypothetical protein
MKVRQLALAMEALGWTVWWDRSLIPGTRWNESIRDELKSSRVAVLAWSEASAASDFVREEAALALAYDKLVPASLDKTRCRHSLDT